MNHKFEDSKYDSVLRPNNEAKIGILNLMAAPCYILLFWERPFKNFVLLLFLCSLAVGSFFACRGWKQYLRQKRLEGVSLSFISVDDLVNKIKSKDHAEDQWIGEGFIWEQRHTQGAFDILGTNYKTVIKDPYSAQRMGAGWIHGLEVNETDLWQPLKHIEGHTLITGNPGTGKTRLFDLLINQCVQRGESVLIIDPKGDFDMRENARSACAAAGCEDRFEFFHPAFPEESIAINPLKNYNRITELASRISALLPKGGSSDAFTSFAWNVVDNICEGMQFCSIDPSLVKLRHYIENGFNDLIIEAITKHAENIDQKEDAKNGYIHTLLKQIGMANATPVLVSDKTSVKRKSHHYDETKTAVTFYKDKLAYFYPNAAIDGLISLFEHDREHYAKMISNLPPVLTMLTSGSMRNLLSPEEGKVKNQIFDMAEFINQKRVVYIGLDALSDAEVGHKIGSLLLADLASVAGERFNFVKPEDMAPVNVFIDEASEVLNEPFIQLLNKGRGAAMRLFVATQSISDFAATMGSKDRANQILGNINNKFALRTLDKATQNYMSEHMPNTRVKYVVKSQSIGSNSKYPLIYHSGSESRVMEDPMHLFPPQLFSLLPNLEYIAFISGGITLKGRIPIITRAEKPKSKSVSVCQIFIKGCYLKAFIEAVLFPELQPWGRWHKIQTTSGPSLPSLKVKVDMESYQCQ